MKLWAFSLLTSLMGSCQSPAQPPAPIETLSSDSTMEKAILASGCFWGTEYFLQRIDGVVSTTVGYTGGHVENPTYEQVCTKRTGHYEATEVLFDPSLTSYEDVLRMFFETHDPTQRDGQGPDIGPQYRSAVFYLNQEQKATAEMLIGLLKAKGYDVATEVLPAAVFYPAENYHQDYYNHKGSTPYCHGYRPLF
jgi:peptide methionine sulfoxide reductase msrA/msrB